MFVATTVVIEGPAKSVILMLGHRLRNAVFALEWFNLTPVAVELCLNAAMAELVVDNLNDKLTSFWCR